MQNIVDTKTNEILSSERKLEQHYLTFLDKTKEFIETNCPKGKRDISHGYEHFEAVAKNVELILDFRKITNVKKRCLSLAMAWLHDFADRKYDKDGTLFKLLHSFLNSLLSDADVEIIETCIDHGSYSKQNKQIIAGTFEKWNSVLGEFKELCDILNNADKLEALDSIGLERCVEYAKHAYLEKNRKSVEFKELQKLVHEHSLEKLLRLKDNFFFYSTPESEEEKKLVEAAHNRFKIALDSFLAQNEDPSKKLDEKVNSRENITALKKNLDSFLTQGISGVYMSVYRLGKDEKQRDLLNTINPSAMYLTLFATYLNTCWHGYGTKNDKYIVKIFDEILEKKIIRGIVCLLNWFVCMGEKVFSVVTREEVLQCFVEKNIDNVRNSINKILHTKLSSVIEAMPLETMSCQPDSKCDQTYNYKDLFVMTKQEKK